MVLKEGVKPSKVTCSRTLFFPKASLFKGMTPADADIVGIENSLNLVPFTPNPFLPS